MNYVISIICLILVLAGLWKMFEKAGRQGWEGIIPIYNLVIILILLKKNPLLVLLILVPILNIIMLIIWWYKFLRKYTDNMLHLILGILFPFVIAPYLGFGDAKYKG